MQTTSDHRFQTTEDARAFALAGNAIITLQSARTGNHFTYKIVAPDAEKQERRGFAPEPVWFVKLLTSGSADQGEFTYLGMIRNQGPSGLWFATTRATRVRGDSACILAFNYFFNHRGEKDLIVRHECRCGRCGRTLTEPESIDSGYGPECRAILGIEVSEMTLAQEAAERAYREREAADDRRREDYVFGNQNE
jgi:hypothetical protein